PTTFATENATLVTDTTAGWHFAARGLAFPSGPSSANSGCGSPETGVVIALAAGYHVSAGDSLSISMANVTNPSAGTVSDFGVSTSSDTVAAFAPPYGIGVEVSPQALVSVDRSTTGALATYTLSDLHASSAMVGGTDTLTLEGPTGTVLPSSPGAYSVQDSTTPSGSGAVTTLLAGGGTAQVTFVVPQDIRSGDILSIVVQDVVNPASAGPGYTLNLIGSVSGPLPAAPFPHADVTYPNGSIVDFSGTDYVFAGGHPFGVQSPAALAALRAVDHAAVQVAPAGVALPTAPPRAGTVVSTKAVDGAQTVYVAGTGGALHGFASPNQLTADGYDPAMVVTVTSLSGLSIGPTAGALGPVATALSTAADGALVDSAGTYFVFAGGRAFGIPGTLALATVREHDLGRVLIGAVSAAQESASIANGVLVGTSGPVYASYQGKLYPFTSINQLEADGYAGTAVVPVPGISGLSVVTYGAP
ncbi:MAG: hypothetical protein ACRDZX_16070, partial [Acidimicrobiales bacterium]